MDTKTDAAIREAEGGLTSYQTSVLTAACIRCLGHKNGFAVSQALIAFGAPANGECFFVKTGGDGGSAGIMSTADALSTAPVSERVNVRLAASRGAVVVCFDDGRDCLVLPIERVRP